MKFQMVHENYNVFDLERSLKFYEEALGLTEKRRITAKDGSFIIVYVGNDTTDFLLELLPGSGTGIGPTTLGTMSSTWRSERTTSKKHTSTIRRWDASATKIRIWASTS